MQDARSLASVIGEDELSDTDKKYLEFGKAFEANFINQDMGDNRTIDQTLDLGWKLLSILPKSELDRMSSATIEAHYVEGAYKTILNPESAGGDGKLN